jgi:hypothetical protein
MLQGSAAPHELPEQDKYTSLISRAEQLLPQDAHVGYIPTSDAPDYQWNAFGVGNSSVERQALDQLGGELASGTSPIAVTILSREHVRVDPPADEPRRNTTLTQTSITNTERGIATWRTLSEAAPDRDIVFIPSGKAHIAKIGVFSRLQKALEAPSNGDVAGDPTGYELAAEAEVSGLTTEDFAMFLERATSSLDTEGQERFSQAVFGSQATAKDLEAAKTQMITDFSIYPQTSEAELMAEQAEVAGVPHGAIQPETASWDTITQLVWLREWAERNGSQDVVVVVGEDQLPRVAVLIAKVLSGTGIRPTLVGSDPRLDAGEFPDTFTREERTMQTGSAWLDEVLAGNPSTHQIMQRLYNHPEYGNPPLKNLGYRGYMLGQRRRNANDLGVR